MAEKKALTHTAYALKRETRISGRWLEIGSASADEDGTGFNVFLDRLPIGGFNGHVYLRPVGTKPEDPEPQPQPPGRPSDDEG